MLIAEKIHGYCVQNTSNTNSIRSNVSLAFGIFATFTQTTTQQTRKQFTPFHTNSVLDYLKLFKFLNKVKANFSLKFLCYVGVLDDLLNNRSIQVIVDC